MKISSNGLRWLLYASIISAGLVLSLTGCKKDHDDHPSSGEDVIEKYKPHLPADAVLQLRDVRNATQRYRFLNAAISDGYADINVVTENMGFHFMKASLVDTLFEPIKPEILVYNKQHNGDTALVAVEYAVPLPLMPDHAPEGFAGAADVWTYSTTFNLWLLHAWVWEYNPLGVFVPVNPNVHLH